MLKYHGVAVSFIEFPDEISLLINISNCPVRCPHCSEPWLQTDIGDELSMNALDVLIKGHPGITTVGLMGGDSSHEDVSAVGTYVHMNHLKFGFYSGLDYIVYRDWETQ